jgi:hypothetical protein
MEPIWQRTLKGGCLGALGIGFVCFAAGFFGPIIFAPESNQGPLLGIFITGPLGAVAGAIIGALVAWRRASRGQP